MVWRSNEEIQLTTALNAILHAEGFHAVIVGVQSRHPIYAVRRAVTGVARAMKNLIFVSTGPKPEVVLRDAGKKRFIDQ